MWGGGGGGGGKTDPIQTSCCTTQANPFYIESSQID